MQHVRGCAKARLVHRFGRTTLISCAVVRVKHQPIGQKKDKLSPTGRLHLNPDLGKGCSYYLTQVCQVKRHGHHALSSGVPSLGVPIAGGIVVSNKPRTVL